MKKKLFVILLAIAVATLSGCGKVYSESDINNAMQQAYNEGYAEGYRHGAYRQQEEDYEEFLIDGRSIRNIVEEVYEETDDLALVAVIAAAVAAYEGQTSTDGFVVRSIKKAKRR